MPDPLRDEAPAAAGKPLVNVAAARSLVAQRDLVGLGDVVGLGRSESLAGALARLAQELKGVSGWTPRSGGVRMCPVLLDQMGLEGCRDFIERLQRWLNRLS